MTIIYSDSSVKLSKTELDERVSRAATALSKAGVRPGDAVALLLRNDFAFFEATMAAGQLGAFVVPMNWHFKGDEIAYLLDDSGAKLLVAHADLYYPIASEIRDRCEIRLVPTPEAIVRAYGVDPALANVRADDLAWGVWISDFACRTEPPAPSPGNIVYTSGTSGRPKGVRRDGLSSEQVAARNEGLIKGFGLEPGIISAVTGPMYHGSTNGHGLNTVALGGTAVLLPRFDAEDLLRCIDEFKIENLTLVPTMFIRLLALPEEVRQRYDISSLKFVSHGAAPCPPAVKQAMIEWFGPIIEEFYAATEVSGISRITAAEWLEKPGSVGKPTVPLLIVGKDGESLSQGEIGEIFVRPRFDFSFQNLPGARQDLDRDGYVATGDIGYLDTDGYLFLSDRKRDMVISGGVNIYPAEIEAILIQMPGVRDCALFGIPDHNMGEHLAAAVELQPGHSLNADDVRAWVRERAAGYKVPKLVEFHARLPRTDTGKIFKNELRWPHWANAGRNI